MKWLRIVLNPDLLDELQKITNKMRSNHIILAVSETFEKIYSLELSIYEEGMSPWLYNHWLEKYGFQKIPSKEKIQKFIKFSIEIYQN